MTSIPLSGSGWQCGVATTKSGHSVDLSNVEEWLPAEVPGHVQQALITAGRIPDPFWGLNNQENGWIEQLAWWYKKDFALEPVNGKRAHLVLEGLDYLADIYLNGHLLGRHEGMFARQVYDVTELLVCEGGEREAFAGLNTLAVRLEAARDLPKFKLSLRDALGKWLAKALLRADLFPDRLATLKCQMGFGWDFAPRLLTSGIWDDVFLHFSDTVYLRDVFARSAIDADGALVRVTVDVSSVKGVDCELVINVEGANFASSLVTFSQATSLPAGDSVQDVSFRLPSPRVWQPWDRGQANLYRLRAEMRQDGSVLDLRETTFGIREVALAPNAGAPRGSAGLTLVINGEKEFIRGANWVPADSIYARVTTTDYAELIALAKAANVNLLRVWGGGLREKRAFYDLCDAEGILVWQEFPLACAFFDHFPADDRFLGLMEDEARGIVRSLRNHPSLTIWCGGNEFAPSRNKKLVQVMKAAAEEVDGTRPFLPASPGKGDGHNWRVWHGKANVRDYRKDDSLLASEFGLQAAPDVSSLVRFLPKEALSPPGKQWEYHSAQLDKLHRYAAPFAPRDLDTFVEATQRAQAIGLQVAIEHFRRRKGRTSGTLVWQLNEPWPAICWSLVDFFRRPKLAYHKLKDLYNPVLISLSYPLKKYAPGDTFTAQVWAINDLLYALEDCDLRLFLGDTLVHSQKLSLRQNCSGQAGKVEFALARVGELRVELRQGENVISRNSYDLTYFDPAGISLWDALKHWIAWRVLK